MFKENSYFSRNGQMWIPALKIKVIQKFQLNHLLLVTLRIIISDTSIVYIKFPEKNRVLYINKPRNTVAGKYTLRSQ